MQLRPTVDNYARLCEANGSVTDPDHPQGIAHLTQHGLTKALVENPLTNHFKDSARRYEGAYCCSIHEPSDSAGFPALVIIQVPGIYSR